MTETWADQSVMKVMDIIKEAPSEQAMEEVLCLTCAFGIAAIRGLRGDAFVQEFLDGAKADKLAVAILKGSVQ